MSGTGYRGYASAKLSHDATESEIRLQRHGAKQNFLGTIIGMGLTMFGTPWLLGTLGMGTAAVGTSGATTGWLGKVLPKVFTPEKMAAFGKTKWFRPMVKGLLSSGGYLAGSHLAGKAPDTPFGLGTQASLNDNRRLFGPGSAAAFGQGFMNEFSLTSKESLISDLLDTKDLNKSLPFDMQEYFEGLELPSGGTIAPDNWSAQDDNLYAQLGSTLRTTLRGQKGKKCQITKIQEQ